MKLAKGFGGSLLAFLLLIGMGLFLLIGVCVLAAGDFFRMLGSRTKERISGEKYRRYMPKQYDGPPLNVDANGFVEPPAVPYYGRHATASRYGAPALQVAARARPLAVALLPDTGLKVLQFPADPHVRAQIRARSKRQPVVVPAGGPKVVYMADYRRRKRR